MKLLLNNPTVVLAAVIILNLASTQAEKAMRPKFHDKRLWSDEKFVTHDVEMDASDPHVNLTLNVLQKLHNIDLHIEASIVHKQSPDHFLTVNTTINLCNILQYNMKSPVGNLLVIYLKQYGNLLETCPIKKGSYYLRKFWIPEDTALSNFAEHDFVVDFTATHVDASKQKTVIIKDHFSGEMVVEDVKNVKPGFLAVLPRSA